MTKTLTIIGNGFDLHHGLRSSYNDFGEYVKIRNPTLFRELNKYLSFGDNWSHFEESLAEIDTDTLLDEADEQLTNYGSDEWRDSANHDYQFTIERIIKIFTEYLINYFTEWINTINNTKIDQDIDRLKINKEMKFLNFNYTDTLQRHYNIPDDRILHIHGRVKINENLIIGHSSRETFSKTSEDNDPRINDGIEIINKYLTDTRKPVSKIINNHIKYFNDLFDTKLIIVIGHSMSSVDHDYFNQVNLAANGATWNIYTLSENQNSHFENQLKSIGIYKYCIHKISKIII